MRRIPSLNWLRVFEAAARTSSFARAAERLAMSPPAVSQQIRALEDHLGKPLFTRAAAGVTLTEEGRSLLVVASDAIGRIEAAADALSAPVGPPLVIAVSQTLYTGWLSPRLPRFLGAHPNVTLELRSLLGREIAPRDAILWISFGQPPPGAEGTPLFGETLVPVATPAIAARIRSSKDLVDHPLIEVADHRKNWTHFLGVDVLPQTARKIHVDTTLAALSLAGSGCGIAIARPPATDDLIARFGLVRCAALSPVPGVENYHIATNLGTRLSPEARAFRDWIIEETAHKTDAWITH